MKRLLLLSLLAVVALPAQAQAATPCRDKIFNDWYADGKIASTYSHACYVDALRHIPPDAKVYSNLGDDILAAMRASARHAEGKAAPTQVGHGFTTHSVLAVSHTQSSQQSSAQSQSSSSAASHDPSLGETSASGSVAGAPAGTPLPLLVLGALALALVAAGAIGAGVKHSRSRRR